MAPGRQPIFNVPGVVLGFVVVLALIQLVTDWMNPLAQFRMLANFAFVPGRFTVAYNPSLVAASFDAAAAQSESAAELATFFLGDGKPLWHTAITYALLHGGWAHVGVNCLWLVAFGSALARRFGTARFLIFCVACAVGGALAHYLTHRADLMPMVGASAVVSGAMAAVVRFAFQPGAPLDAAFALGRSQRAYTLPALPLSEVASNRTALSFLAVWFIANFLFGAFPQTIGMTDASIAWQAHVGGFLVGLFAFKWFDPPARPALPPS
ncbi:rhomboid family intramembrane serine protease [Methylocella sp.]|uniref:rhomboid family intramembrane serine protease n=1 Tax=Methylocella sp. TaxID=1978226 RepID=UPI0035B08E39